MSCDLRERIISYIDNPRESDFNSLALEVFNFQVSRNSDYDRYCQGQIVSHWSEIPLVVTDVYKLESAQLRSFTGSAEAVFHTSGTTSSETGKHAFKSLDLYSASVLHGFENPGPGQTLRQTYLTSPPGKRPHSSLVKMFGILSERQPNSSEAFLDVSSDTFSPKVLQDLCDEGQPLMILGTAIQFLTLIEKVPSGIALPLGSKVMETGGYKATGVEISKETFYRNLSRYLNVKTDDIWNEYSMTELSSQFYTKGLNKAHQGPLWAKTRILNPETLEEVGEGETGYVAIYDLANLDSFCAVLTQDFAVRRGSDFELLGRDPSALPRGCSRMR